MVEVRELMEGLFGGVQLVWGKIAKNKNNVGSEKSFSLFWRKL
jgi:hypothetical protein